MLLLSHSPGAGGYFGEVGSELANSVLGGESALGWCLGTALTCCVILAVSYPLWASVFPHFMIPFGSEMGLASPSPRIVEEEKATLECSKILLWAVSGS